MIASMLYLPYVTNASFLIFFSTTMLLLPPLWQAAQLPVKTPSPFSKSAASAGRPLATATSNPRAAPSASGLNTLLDCVAAISSATASSCAWAALAPLMRGAGCDALGATKHCTPTRASEAAATRQAHRDMVRREEANPSDRGGDNGTKA